MKQISLLVTRQSSGDSFASASQALDSALANTIKFLTRLGYNNFVVKSSDSTRTERGWRASVTMEGSFA